ncbi:M20/M25/M40 family metallo-hydrolase [Ulvibacter antarcticus]|nr:M20/M25/M40 family metallo-hydrolase [Ulvibacter antarcticus]
MKRMKQLLLIVTVLVAFLSTAQETKNFYATMSLQDAKELKQDMPAGIEILAERRNEAAVYLTPEAGHYVHEKVLVHGPGYIYKASAEDAIAAIHKDKPVISNKMGAFTISEDAIVNAALDLVNTQNIEDQILELQNYGTRYHNRASATQAAEDLKTKWETMAADAGRTDVSVRLYNHSGTNMPSVIMTIEGSEEPLEFVIVGGHLDSTSNQGNNDAPGADDDASGISTITEAARTLFEVGFVPARTIEFMAYAAEEIGLVGSGEIAQEYSNNGVDVISAVQFDMTNYNGSANDISFITDHTSGTLNSFLMQLADHYNASGPHQISYSTSLCNYGCSDHASWTNEGYMASFPFEANFGQHNPNIHTPDDTFSVSGTADHAAKFTKLCIEYLIETAKSGNLSVDEHLADTITLIVDNGNLEYNLEATGRSFTSLRLYDMLGKTSMETSVSSNIGTVSLQNVSAGIYVASFVTENNTLVSKKIVVK